MSENRKHGIVDFSQYDSMDTEKLEDILRSDAVASDDTEADIEKMLYIMGVLEQREDSYHPQKTPQQAYASFLHHYMPQEDSTDKVQMVRRMKKTPVRFLRRITAVAAILAIIICASVAVKSFEFGLWNTSVGLHQDGFFFQDDPQETNPNSDLPFASMEEALLALGFDPSIIPTWIPDGFVLVDIYIHELPQSKSVEAFYKSGEKSLRVVVCLYDINNPIFYEHNGEFTEVSEDGGLEFYLFENMDRQCAAWRNGEYECSIDGDITRKELKKMIDSIEKG